MSALPSAERSELFVYYRADAAHAAALAAAVQRMQAALCAHHAGLAARLLRRPELREGQHTWMETYTLPAGADAARMADLIEQSAAQALSPWLAGPRHVEHFTLCAS